MDENKERRQNELSDDQLEKVARRAAELVWENFRLEVGTITIRSALRIIGLGCLALVAYFGFTEKIKL